MSDVGLAAPLTCGGWSREKSVILGHPPSTPFPKNKQINRSPRAQSCLLRGDLVLPIWKQDRGEGEGIGLVFDAGAGNGGELGDTVSTKNEEMMLA